MPISEEMVMIPAARRHEIRQRILEEKTLTVSAVASALGVSEETVRRDFQQLEREGVLTRTHGGAIIANRVSPQVTNADLEGILVDAKEAIARQALMRLSPRMCVYLDSSTTSLTLARKLKVSPVTVVSNSLAILSELSTRSDVQLVGVGGTLSKTRRCFVGRSAKEMLGNYYFDLVFLSSRSLDLDRGVTDSSDEEIEVKTTVMQRTNRIILLADHSKFGRASFSKICDFEDLDDVITDIKPRKDWIDAASESNVRISWENSDSPGIES